MEQYFENYEDAKAAAARLAAPLWDTHQLPYRYYVGYLGEESLPEAEDWTEISAD